MKPLVSVIIPTYNRLEFLKQTLESVKAQTYTYFEIIIADDGSDDGTEDYLRDLDIRYVRLSHSGMPGLVRNRGVEIAKGEYLAFLDSDDLWKPEKLEKQIDFFSRNPNAVICHTREVWNRSGEIISQKNQKHKRSGLIFKDALKKCIIGPSTVMIKKQVFDALGMFREDLEIAEDYELWLRLTSKYAVGYIDEPLIIKRGGHEDQLSLKYGHIEFFRIKALKLNVDKGAFNPEQMNLAAAELVRKCRIYSKGCAKRGKKEEGDDYKAVALDYRKRFLI